MGARIQLCGRLEVELAGQRVDARLPGRQGPLVVAVLVLNRNRPVTRDELIGVLWPAQLPADPEESLSVLLSKVRQAVGREMLVGRRELTLALPEDAEIDVERATAAAEEARGAVARGDWSDAAETAAAAADVIERGFLPGHHAPWVEERRAELEELRLGALELVAEASLGAGGDRLAAAERAARDLVRDAPLRETGHRLLMEALAGRGEVAEALAAYERLRVLLRDELGTAPGAQVRALHERLLAGEPAPPRHAPRAVPVRPRLPAPLAIDGRGEFVGREHELECLLGHWATARAGTRGVTMLSGGPGIGKTRLAGELARVARRDGTVLFGACQEDALVAYQPFVEALRHYVRAGGAAAPGPGGAELADLIPELTAVANDGGTRPDDPETRRYLMFEAVVAMLADASAREPVLLVLDDLHWADRSTLQLLRHLTRAQEDFALLIVGTYRDSDVPAGHPLGELIAGLRRGGRFERFALEGLDETGVDALIEQHAGDPASSAVVRTIHAETAGNPFFVLEMVRHLRESGFGIESAESGDGELAREIGVPEGVKEVLELRLARLSPQCQAVLARAAVLGREFRFEPLAAMSEAGDEAVVEALEEALAARLVHEQRGSHEASYGFAHALVRETLYEGLSAARRQRMHARAAQAIQSAPAADPDGDLAALAVHSRLAGSAGDLEKGIEYSLRAGERARELFAWTEALAHWDGALGLMDRAGTEAAVRARLLVGLAEVCAGIGDLGRQIDYLERALEVQAAAGDEQRAAQVHSRLGQAYSLIDSVDADHLDIGRAFEHFDAARAVLGRGPARASRGHLETGVASALMYALDIPAGIEAARRGMDIGEQFGDELLWAGAANAYAWHSVVAGSLSEGFGVLDRSFEAGDRHRRWFMAFMPLQMGGQLTWGLGSPDEARAYLERARSLPYGGRTAYRQEIADGLGRCHLSKGEVEDARRLLPEARSAWITHSLEPLLGLWDGEMDAVAALAERVLVTSRRTRNRWDEWCAHHFAARVHHLRGELEPALMRLDQALAIVADGGAQYFELWVRPDMARVAAELGRLEDARAHADRAAAIVANGEDWRGRAGVAAIADAVVLSHEGRADEADARFDAALETLASYSLVAEQADCRHQRERALQRA